MATLAQISKPENILPGWGYYTAAEVDSGDTQNKWGQQFLNDMHKFDPNAHWEVANQYGGGGEGGGGGGQTMMRLAYDPSKLPGGDRPAMVDMNHGAYAGFRHDDNASYGGHLFKPEAVGTDPHGYGRVTSPRNMNLAADNDPGMIGRMAPALIAAIATVMSGGAASPLLISAMTQGPGMLNNASHGNFNPMQLAGMVAQGFGVPSWATGAASTAYGLSQGRKPNPVGAGMSLANIVNNVGPGG